MSIKDFNKGGHVFEIDLKKVTDWRKAKDLICTGFYEVKAVGKHDSKYGTSVFMVVNSASEGIIGVNLPSWYEETIDSIKKDSEAVSQIKNGEAFCEFASYKTREGQETVNVIFMTKEDLLPPDEAYPF